MEIASELRALNSMPRDAFDHIQLASIKRAADRVAEGLGAVKEKDKLAVAKAVFDIAAETDVCDTAPLVEMAQGRLTPQRGWRFPSGREP